MYSHYVYTLEKALLEDIQKTVGLPRTAFSVLGSRKIQTSKKNCAVAKTGQNTVCLRNKLATVDTILSKM